MAADVDTDHVTMVSHAMVDRPPWEQLDLDANDYLVDGTLGYWNNVDGTRQESFAAADVIPGAASKTEDCGATLQNPLDMKVPGNATRKSEIPGTSSQRCRCWWMAM